MFHQEICLLIKQGILLSHFSGFSLFLSSFFLLFFPCNTELTLLIAEQNSLSPSTFSILHVINLFRGYYTTGLQYDSLNVVNAATNRCYYNFFVIIIVSFFFILSFMSCFFIRFTLREKNIIIKVTVQF